MTISIIRYIDFYALQSAVYAVVITSVFDLRHTYVGY